MAWAPGWAFRECDMVARGGAPGGGVPRGAALWRAGVCVCVVLAVCWWRGVRACACVCICVCMMCASVLAVPGCGGRVCGAAQVRGRKRLGDVMRAVCKGTQMRAQVGGGSCGRADRLGVMNGWRCLAPQCCACV